jgi:hypothetical protein
MADEIWILFLELDADPYNPDEVDPARSHALESCLWELQVRTPCAWALKTLEPLPNRLQQPHITLWERGAASCSCCCFPDEDHVMTALLPQWLGFTGRTQINETKGAGLRDGSHGGLLRGAWPCPVAQAMWLR